MSKRLRSKLVWQSAPESAAKNLVAHSEAPPLEPSETPSFQTPMAPRDQAIALLHVGSEVEHALMVQYLYAAYSLNEHQPDDLRRQLVRSWKSIILEIAREEMGHLATVQNLLTVIGGPLSFEREDYPIIDPELWPFPFQLEPLTKTSLAKYVLAEMPSRKVLRERGLEAEVEAIIQRLHSGDCLNVHRVGLLYGKIAQLFQTGPMIQGPAEPPYTNEHPYIATVDIQASHLRYQASSGAWGLGQKQILVLTAFDRDSAAKAINLVSVQGEGSDIEADLEHSHFGRFLKIYRAFPEDADWRASKLIATDPTTSPATPDPARQIRGAALPLANLFNLRYRMLLLYLLHSFHLESQADGAAKSPRGSLVSWAFGEMYHLRSLSEILMSMPLSPGSPLHAGPPFEMPYSLGLAPLSPDRWRQHRDLLTQSISLVGELLDRTPESQSYLRALRTADETALQQVIALIGA